MKRILIHLTTHFTALIILSQFIGLVTFFYFKPLFQAIYAGYYFLIFLPFIWLLSRWLDKKRWNKFLKILFVASFGTLLTYIFLQVEINFYSQWEGIETKTGWFVDEFWESIYYIFPILVIAESICFLLEKRKNMLVFGLSAFTYITIIAYGAWIFYPGTLPNNVPGIQKANGGKPNVVIILADDLGYNDISLYGNQLIQTPNIDAIGKNGVTFTRGYCSAPVCAPSRAGMLTGRYQQRFGFEYLSDMMAAHPRVRQADFESFGNQLNQISWLKASSIRNRGIEHQELTLSELLKQAGYATGIIGKWHLGLLPRFRPDKHGFDYHFGIYNAAALYADANDPKMVISQHPWDFVDNLSWRVLKYEVFENGKRLDLEYNEYLTDVLATKCVDYIEEHKEEQFFLYAAFTAPHSPFQAPKEIYDKLKHIKDHNRRVYYAMILSLDQAVGQIVEKLKKEGLYENTIIFFSSDNGGATYTRACDNSPFYGGKFTEYEGGLVVPFMMSWGDKITKPTLFEHPVSLLDIYPTVAQATETNLPNDVKVDGVDLLPFLTKATHNEPHEVLYWKNGYISAIQKGGYKLHINEKEGFTYLHNLKTDVSEQKNLAAENPQKVAELKQLWNSWAATLAEPYWQSNGNTKIPLTPQADAQEEFFPW